MARGTFIVIEGGDGVGKDTQVSLLQKEFGDFLYTREPGGTALGKVLREMLLHEAHGSLPPLTEAFIFLADRAQHVSEVIAPALASGKNVVSNRSWISMLAYQIYGREGFDMQSVVESATSLIYRDCPIDLAIILDAPPEVGAARQRAQGKPLDVLESLPLEARERIRNGFLEVAKGLPKAVLLDADRSVEEVYRDVRTAVLGAIGRQ